MFDRRARSDCGCEWFVTKRLSSPYSSLKESPLEWVRALPAYELLFLLMAVLQLANLVGVGRWRWGGARGARGAMGAARDVDQSGTDAEEAVATRAKSLTPRASLAGESEESFSEAIARLQPGERPKAATQGDPSSSSRAVALHPLEVSGAF